MPDPLPPIKDQPPTPGPTQTNSDGLASSRTLVVAGGTVAVLLVGLIIGGLVGSKLGKSETETVTITSGASDAASNDGKNAESSASSGVSVNKPSASSLKIGSTGDVAGLFAITLDSFKKTSSGGSSSKYRASMTVKNLGSEGVEPFCGDSGAVLIDSKGRSFEGKSVLYEETLNCGDEIGPGLSKGPYAMEFELPSDAEPSELKLFGDYDYEDDAVSWNVS